MRVVEHPDLGFAFEAPDDWPVTTLPDGLVAAPADDAEDRSLPPGFAVTFTSFGGGDHDAASLAEQGLLEEMRFLTDLRLLDEEDVELPGGIPARRSLGTYRQGISSLTIEQWHAVHDGRALVVCGTGPTEDYAVLHELWRAMVGSLRLRDDG